MTGKTAILLCMLTLILCSCGGQRRINAFKENDEIRLQVGSNVQFRYDPLKCQMAFSRSQMEFRAHTDNMSDFYIVQLSSIPVNEGEKVSAKLIWTTATDVLTRNNLTLEAVRIEGDKIWLWSDSGRIGVSILTLE